MKKDGGPAFPTGEVYDDWDWKTSNQHLAGLPKQAEKWSGMSLRDYFAASIAQGSHLSEWDDDIKCKAQRIFALADAMIEERDK